MVRRQPRRKGPPRDLRGAGGRQDPPGEDPIGVISASPAVAGDGDMGAWKQRWLRDDYGSLLRDADGQPQENPAYDASRAYVPRRRRPEWALVGLLGKLRLRRGQPAGSRWIRMRAVTPELADWLVR